jgi:hypothetical protein
MPLTLKVHISMYEVQKKLNKQIPKKQASQKKRRLNTSALYPKETKGTTPNYTTDTTHH